MTESDSGLSLSRRSSGILLHPTSLPGPYGIGDLGMTAYAWIDALVRAKQKWWQILPLGPTGYADSPYQCFSAFAGNPYLVSPKILVEENLLKPGDLSGFSFPAEKVDFGPVIQFKVKLLRQAWENFQARANPALRLEFEAFCAAQSSWLEDFALFMALKDEHGGVSWLEWEPELILREPLALAQARKRLSDGINQHKFRQFLFFHQWFALKAYAHAKGIHIIGDAPIFVSSDSADVWAHPNIFLLDERRQPKVVAGVPPDYFSRTGQLWGNPLYDWTVLKATGYQWWIDRLLATLQQVDLIRLDHFRGFEAYWEIPAGMPTAEIGRWVKGPGAEVFEAIRAGLGDPSASLRTGPSAPSAGQARSVGHGLRDEASPWDRTSIPIIAEDLGIITPEVEALRDRYGLPGMKILQFAFAGAVEDRFLPHNYERNCVVYTGTHDNDTTRGWYLTATEKERDFCRRYLGRDGREIAWDLIRLAWASVADYAIAPLQDVLDLGPEARMNLPGTSSGNWHWRFTETQLTGQVLDRLGELTGLYGR